MTGDGDGREPGQVVELSATGEEGGEAAPEPGSRRRGGVLDDGVERLPVEDLEDPARLRAVLESVLLVADRPLAPARLTQLLGGTVDPAEIRDVLDRWREELDGRKAGIRLLRVAGGYRLRTDAANAPWVRALTRRRPVRLSRAALETMAIVAYRQPVTRADVDDVRGVDSSVVLRSLLEKELLRIVGRKEDPGRPMIYGTTRRFLEVFGLGALSDLPSLQEFTELAVGEQESLFGDHALLDGGAAEGIPERGEPGEEEGGDDAA